MTTAIQLSTEALRLPRRPRIVRRAAVREAAPLLGFVAITAAAAAIGAQFNPTARNRRTQAWYATQRKSPLNPPPVVFGPVWTVLYAMIATAGWRVYRAPKSAARSRALTWWAAQMVLNTAWTPLFFGAKRPELALIDIAALEAAIGAFGMTAKRVDRSAAALVVPYAAWVAFAGYLNAEIVRRNR